MHGHEFIKAEIALQLVDASNGRDIFSRTQHGKSHSNFITTALENFIDESFVFNIFCLLNKPVKLGETMSYMISYLRMASGQLHDSVRAKFSIAFLWRTWRKSFIFQCTFIEYLEERVCDTSSQLQGLL